jgi:DNA-directed RNA polymerase subunit RPC12/RpoP
MAVQVLCVAVFRCDECKKPAVSYVLSEKSIDPSKQPNLRFYVRCTDCGHDTQKRASEALHHTNFPWEGPG